MQAYITALRKNSAVINTAITIACTEGIIKSHDSNLLKDNGGHIHLTKFWAKNLMQQMGLVKRRASTKAKVSVEDFAKLKEQLLDRRDSSSINNQVGPNMNTIHSSVKLDNGYRGIQAC